MLVSACLRMGLLIYLHSQCSALEQKYAIYKFMGFEYSASNSFTFVDALTESICAFKCNNAATACHAAEYDTVTKQCIMMTKNCMIMQLVNRNTSNLIAIPSMVNPVVRATVFLPLTSSCNQAFTDNYGIKKITDISLTGSLDSLSIVISTGILSSSVNFNNNLTDFPPTSMLTLESNAPTNAFNIFSSSFTVSFSAVTVQDLQKSDPASIYDQPILEFSGGATDEICFAWRFGEGAASIQFAYVINCNFSNGYNILSDNLTTNGTAHYTAVYDANKQTYTIYLDGIFSSITSFTNTPPPITVTSMRIGGSMYNNWTAGYYGAVGCVQLFDFTLSDKQVADLFDLCVNTSPRLVNY